MKNEEQPHQIFLFITCRLVALQFMTLNNNYKIHQFSIIVFQTTESLSNFRLNIFLHRCDIIVFMRFRRSRLKNTFD